MYFLVVFIANLLNTLIFLVSLWHKFVLPCHSNILQLAEEDLKVVGAEFTQLITSIMISRLVLNLRSVKDTIWDGYSTEHTRAIRFVTGAVGNLGEELDTFVDTSLGSLHDPSLTLRT